MSVSYWSIDCGDAVYFLPISLQLHLLQCFEHVSTTTVLAMWKTLPVLALSPWASLANVEAPTVIDDAERRNVSGPFFRLASEGFFLTLFAKKTAEDQATKLATEEAQEEAKEGMEDGPRIRCFPAELAVFSR
eukprot:symbB.v1.2.035766.t1/scaffold4896.1/size34818/3